MLSELAPCSRTPRCVATKRPTMGCVCPLRDGLRHFGLVVPVHAIQHLRAKGALALSTVEGLTPMSTATSARVSMPGGRASVVSTTTAPALYIPCSFAVVFSGFFRFGICVRASCHHDNQESRQRD